MKYLQNHTQTSANANTHMQNFNVFKHNTLISRENKFYQFKSTKPCHAKNEHTHEIRTKIVVVPQYTIHRTSSHKYTCIRFNEPLKKAKNQNKTKEKIKQWKCYRFCCIFTTINDSRKQHVGSYFTK